MSKSLKDMYDVVKTDFCGLLDYKLHGKTIEILTGIPTLKNSMVSVFVSHDGEKYVASDGGWIDNNIYDNDVSTDDEMVNRITSQYFKYFDIKNTVSSQGTIYYYKTCKDIALLSAIVHDVGHYIAMHVNTVNTQFSDPSADSKHATQFQSRINKDLRKYYNGNFHPNFQMPLRDGSRIKLSAMINARTNQSLTYYCLMYITGNRKDLFIKDITKATVNFKIMADQSIDSFYYQRIAIVNTLAPGYNQVNANLYLKELANSTDRKPIYLEESGKNLLSDMNNLIQIEESKKQITT